MSPTGLRWAALLLLVAPATCAGADGFLSPLFDAAGGYTSNRFLEPDAEGSWYWRAVPGLEASWFGADDLEVTARATYATTGYLRSGFGRIRQVSGETELHKGFPAGAASLTLSGGTYEDSSLPEDDAWWVGVDPQLSWDPSGVLAASLGLSATHTRYESRRTADGGDQAETLWGIRPGLRWTPFPQVSLWVEASGEYNASNEDAEDFSAAGVAVGGDASWSNGAKAGVWAEWRLRRYADGDRHDTPLGIGARASLRPAPWAELFGTATWYRLDSSEAESAYETWGVEGGVRFVYDWQVSGAR